MPNDEYLTTEEAAQLLKIHRDNVRRLIREGKLPSVKVGGQYRLRRKDLEEWLERSREPERHD
jgi:excisionase family DNA binding protein